MPAIAAVVLFVAGALVVGDRPPMDDPAAFQPWVEDNAGRIRAGVALDAVAAALFVWFVAQAGTRAMLGFGIAYAAVFLADLAALATAAIRPENATAAMQDFEWMAIGLATPLGCGFLIAASAIGPPWLRRAALAAAALYALRIGTLFTTEGPFAATGVLGLYVPVAALLAWIALAGRGVVQDPRA